jgi:hypothetical protein
MHHPTFSIYISVSIRHWQIAITIPFHSSFPVFYTCPIGALRQLQNECTNPGALL